MHSSMRDFPTAAVDWAASGAMALTGRADGWPLLAPGAPASVVREALESLPRDGIAGAQMPGVELLGERAAFTGFTRRAPSSPGGAFRPIQAADGWLGLSLARESDVELIPALVEAPASSDPWRDVEHWTRSQPVATAEQRAILLGLPAACIPEAPSPHGRAPVVVTQGGPRSVRGRDRSVVVDLTSLWAGPLCAHLLGLAGARVIKVESSRRLDGSRRGNTKFYNLLHSGHESVVLDFADEVGRSALRSLVAQADVVLEASRPRALAQLGVDAESHVAEGCIWVSITAYGRRGSAASRVGFGDDIAAGAGLVVWTDHGPYPAGDALADPLAGAVSAAAAWSTLASERGALLDVSMHDVARVAALDTDPPNASVIEVDGRNFVEVNGQRYRVADPRSRQLAGIAPPPGEDTEAVAREFRL